MSAHACITGAGCGSQVFETAGGKAGARQIKYAARTMNIVNSPLSDLLRSYSICPSSVNVHAVLQDCEVDISVVLA